MLAAQSNDDVAQLIAERFPHCIEWKNKQGADAVCYLYEIHSPLSVTNKLFS